MASSFTKKAICIAFSAAALTGLSGCSQMNAELENSATKTLDDSGYKDIKLGTSLSDALSCSDDDLLGIGFTAKNPTGKEVSGVVCIGSGFKRNTVRF